MPYKTFQRCICCIKVTVNIFYNLRINTRNRINVF